MDRETRFGILASAILDGTPINWAEAEAQSDPGDQALLRELRIVAEIAALHKQSDGSASAAATQTVAPEPTAAIEWGHLRLFECVGRGSYGEVYRAWDTQLDREVALKLLRASPDAQDPSASLSDPSRVVHEGRLLARVRHPHVITVYGAESRAGRVGIWMEFIRGRTLHEIVEQQGPLGAREAVAVGTDLCGALAAVHAAGLVHRDVTARNVMREEGGRVVLMDFGAGHESQSDSSHVAGTPLYMAPEVLAGTGADQRSDIYSLGALLYYLVSGRYPVTGNSLAAIREAHRLGERTRLRNVRPDLPASFVQAIEMAIAPNLAERCQTAGDFEAALEQSMLSRPTSTHETGRRTWAAPIALAVVGVGAIAGALAVTKPWSVGSASPDGGASSSAAASVIARRIQPPGGVSLLSNPSDDGRFASAFVNETGDVAIVDFTRGDFQPLRIGRGDFSDGMVSLSAISPDGAYVALDWQHADNKGHSLHVVRADGRDHRVLIESAVDVVPYQWSRDGSLILTGVERERGVKTVALIAAADGAIRPIQALGSEWPEQMTLSPDGRFIAYDFPETVGSIDRDLFVIDTHTGSRWPLVVSLGHDSQPLWSPDGRTILFFSDRNRSLSAWTIQVQNGRAQGEPQMVKDNVGRVWPRGFTRDGALHYELGTGFAEVFTAELGSGGAASKSEVITPREALSNFYPVWSGDGRYLAFTSERRAGAPRELWLYDTVTGSEQRVPATQPMGRPFAWSPDGARVLAPDPGEPPLYAVEWKTGRTQLIGPSFGIAAWLRQGIVYRTPQKAVVLYDPDTRRTLRTWSYADPVIDGFGLAIDGRSVLALTKDDRLLVREVERDVVREWSDVGAVMLGNHMMAPHTGAVAYIVTRPGAAGNEQALKAWPGSGAPRELLRASGLERLALAGWMTDSQRLLVLRWNAPPQSATPPPRPTTLWLVPATGGPPVSTGLEMNWMRDLSLHPDGRRIAFNAGLRASEHWVMENLLPR